MLKYKFSQATGKQGVNFIKGIVKSLRHSFIEIHQEDDIGLDCLVQLRDKNQTNRIISMQVKSGNSFFNRGNQTCKIPIDNHREYWKDKEFPVLGVVFVPELYKAFWCDIKKELLINSNSKQISFSATIENEFSHENFIKYVSNLGFPTYFYVARIHEFTQSNNSVKTLLNNISINLSVLVPEIIQFASLDVFFSRIGWKYIVEKEREKTKEKCKYVTTAFPYNQGKMSFSKNCKFLYYNNDFETYFNNKLHELKNKLMQYDKIP